MAAAVFECTPSAPFFGFMGAASALCFANLGAAYGTAKSAVGIASMGVINPNLVMKNLITIIMAGVLGIYGLIIAIIIQQAMVKPNYSDFNGYAHLASGLACGLSSLSAGLSIGVVGDSGVRANGQESDLFVPMVLILIFSEALGLYGLIIAIVLSQSTQECVFPG